MPPRFVCWAAALAVCCAGSLEASEQGREKRVLEDFEDIGTWRLVEASGLGAASWFSGGSYLGGTDAEPGRDGHAGELKFAFDPAKPAPYSAAFRRQKATLVGGFLDGIEFDANPKGLAVSVRFVVADQSGKKFSTARVPLEGAEWKRHRVEIDAKSDPGFKGCRFPARLEQVVLEAAAACEGSLYLDDITLTGDFAQSDLLTVSPVYERIAFVPGEPVRLRYRLRNASPETVEAALEAEVLDFDGKVARLPGQRVEIEGHGQARVEWDAGVLPIGAYSVKVAAAGGRLKGTYEDCFVVIQPNGKRLNARPMWFGVADPANWNGAGEQRLHFEWMRALGVDINRVELTAGRFAGPAQYPPWEAIFNAHRDNGIDISLLVSDTPREAQKGKTGGRLPADDYGAYAAFAGRLGAFLSGQPAIKYVEFWNEPDLSFFQGTSDDYKKMFAAFSAAFRPAAPGIKITNGGVTVIHPREKRDFSRKAIVDCAPYYDVAAFHAHGPLGNYIERQELVEKWLQEAGVDKPVCNTETGERSGYDHAGRRNQAITLVKKIVYAKSRPRSEFYIWFTLQDYGDMDKADDSFGLVTSDNRAKPSFAAYNEVIRQLAGAAPAPAPEGFAGADAHDFIKPDGRHVYVFWPKAGRPAGQIWLKSEGGGARLTGMFGREGVLDRFGPVFSLPLGAEPVYLAMDEPGRALAPSGPEEWPVRMPSVVYGGVMESFPVELRNPYGRPWSGKLLLADKDGKASWEQSFALEPGARMAFTVPLPPEAASPEAPALELRIEDGSPRPPRLPVGVTPAYAIRKILGNPIDNRAARAGLAQLPEIILDRAQDVNELTFDPTIPAWRGKEDLSARARAAHDGKGIYFACDVIDDKHAQDNPPEATWKGDGVQLAVGAEGEAGYTILDLALGKDGPVVWCATAPRGELKGRWNVPAAVTRKGSATAYEIYLPFDKLGIVYEGNRLPLRLSFLVNENDGQGRVRWMNWHGGIGKGADAGRLGHGVLE